MVACGMTGSDPCCLSRPVRSTFTPFLRPLWEKVAAEGCRMRGFPPLGRWTWVTQQLRPVSTLHVFAWNKRNGRW
jgi:hypothetical protein